MIILDYKVGTVFETTCAAKHGEDERPFYDSFGIDAEFCWMRARKPEEIRNVRCTIIEEDVLVNELMKRDSGYDTNKVDYFGWIEFQEDGTLDIRMIYGNIKLYYMCFSSSPDTGRFYSKDSVVDIHGNYRRHAGDRRGMTVRLKVEEID